MQRAKGFSRKILTVLDGIPFGKQYFEVGILLRNSLLVSSMLFNCEAWYNLTSAELALLGNIETQFLSQLLQAPKGTTKEMLILELGCKPFRDIIRERRLGFVQTQLKNRTKRDWGSMVLDDLEKLEMKDTSFEEIGNMKKGYFMKVVKLRNEEKVFKSLEKVKKIEHNSMKIQKYLQLNRTEISREEAHLIFKLRCRVTEAKKYFRM